MTAKGESKKGGKETRVIYDNKTPENKPME